MRDVLSNWIRAHTTPPVLIATLLLVGSLLALTACGLLILYPAYPDKNPIYFVLLSGLFIVGYAGHKRCVNALLRDLRRLLNKGATT